MVSVGWLRLMLSLAVLGFGLGPAAEWPSGDEANQIVESAKGILPGWEITRTERNTTPTGWQAFGSVAFLVEGKRGNDTFSVWFLPLDWIGIRKPGHAVRTNYWEGILVGQHHKTITVSTDSKLPEQVRKLKMSTPSIVNSGWWRTQEIFKDRFKEADETAQRLIAKHCVDRAGRDEAAHSLVVLGVPAKTVFIEGAVNGRGHPRGLCVSALGWFGGKDAVKALCQVVTDRKADQLDRKYAAQGLEMIGDPDAGPALLEGLREATWSEEQWHMTEALARIRYAPAVPKALELLKTSEHIWTRKACAKLLAVCRAKEAVPVAVPLIQKLLKEADIDYVSRGEVHGILLQLTAPWGEPSKGVRLLLQPPKRALLGKPFEVTLHIENVAEKGLDVTDCLLGTLILNGRSQKEFWWAGEGGSGWSTLDVNAVWRFERAFSDVIENPGVYTVRYETGGAVSNEIRFEVKRR